MNEIKKDIEEVIEDKDRKKIIKYDKNPFIEDGLTVKTKNKQIKIGKDGSDLSLLNHQTGDLSATHLVSYKKVDSEQFVKILLSEIALMFDLSKAGIKALSMLCWKLSAGNVIDKDIVRLDKFDHQEYQEFLKNNPKYDHNGVEIKRSFEIKTLYKGIENLEECKILAKNVRPGHYFINPNFVFNGDRVAFTKVYEREKREEELKRMEQEKQKVEPFDDTEYKGE